MRSLRWNVLVIALMGTVALSACGGRSPTTSSRAAPRVVTSTASGGPGSTATTTTDSRVAEHGGGPTTRTSPTAPPPDAGRRALPAGLAGREWAVIPTTRRVVALTFDAGANADGVASILATLAREHVLATMFLTGNFVDRYQAIARQIAAARVRLGDHSISHPYFTQLTDAQMREQVQGAAKEITSVTGADPRPWFRFPYGDRSGHALSVVNATGFVAVGWTVDTLGWEGTSGGITAQAVTNRVLAHLQPGEIVLMHCGSNPTDHSTLDADALPTVIAKLRARGYAFVTLDAFLGRP
jgi:peptidoglycan/xylan/chitin deacetylase (PgdA/CDA1 family)